jgi:hypothetical protein
VRAGFHATDALPLRLRGDVIGALNLFRVRRGELDEADLQVAQAFADIATIAILQHRAAMEAGVLNEQLQRALDSRVVIEQAKGVVAEHLQLSMEDAFAALRGHARAKNLGLVALAQDVVAGVVSPSDLGAPRR